MATTKITLQTLDPKQVEQLMLVYTQDQWTQNGPNTVSFVPVVQAKARVNSTAFDEYTTALIAIIT